MRSSLNSFLTDSPNLSRNESQYEQWKETLTYLGYMPHHDQKGNYITINDDIQSFWEMQQKWRAQIERSGQAVLKPRDYSKLNGIFLRLIRWLQYYNEFAKRASIDEKLNIMTAQASRVYWFDVCRSSRGKDLFPVIVILGDFDKLKENNTKYGYDQSDLLLAAFAAACSAMLNPRKWIPAHIAKQFKKPNDRRTFTLARFVSRAMQGDELVITIEMGKKHRNYSDSELWRIGRTYIKRIKDLLASGECDQSLVNNETKITERVRPSGTFGLAIWRDPGKQSLEDVKQIIASQQLLPLKAARDRNYTS